MNDDQIIVSYEPSGKGLEVRPVFACAADVAERNKAASIVARDLSECIAKGHSKIALRSLSGRSRDVQECVQAAIRKQEILRIKRAAAAHLASKGIK